MPSLTDRLRAMARAYRTPPAPPQGVFGEAAFADPRRLFPGGWLTPYNPTLLISRRGWRTVEQMRQDDQIKAAMAFKKDAVLSTGWQVTSPEGFPDDWPPTRFVDRELKNVEGTLEDDLREVLTALEYGFSVTEMVFNTPTRGEFAGAVGLEALKTRHPSSFLFDQDEFGNLKPDGLVQTGTAAVAQRRLPPWKFAIFSYDLEFENLYGRTDLEAAYTPWWLKFNTYKWLAMLLERLGIPPIFAMYDPTTYTPEQLEQLKTLVTNIQAATFGIMPRKGGAAGLEMWAPEIAGQATRVFIPAIEACDRAIARALLMPGHMGLTADTTQGSFARAKVSFDAFLLIVERLRKELAARVMQDRVVRTLVDLNFGPQEVYPIWSFMPLTDDTRLDLITSWKELVSADVVVPQDGDEQHIRQMLRWPEKAMGTRIAEGRTVQTAPFGGGPFGPDPDERGLMRQYARYDRAVAYKRIERDLDRLEAEARQRIGQAIGDLRDRLLAKVGGSFPKKPGDVTAIESLRGIQAVHEAIREFLRAAFEAGDRALRAELPSRRFAFEPGLFVPADALRWLAAKAVTISGVLERRLLDEAKAVLLNALKFGEPQAETIGKLRAVFEPYLGNPDVVRDGKILEAFRLETIIRTNATEAFNQGRLTLASDPDVRDFVKGMQYSAVIDSRTTEVCRFLDGKVFPMDEPELRRLSPPNHWNCRSLLVPVVTAVDEGDFITPSEIGKAEELAQQGFK